MVPSLYFVVLAVGLLVLSLVVPPVLAARKGYAWYLWTIFAAGLVGLIVLAFLPAVHHGSLKPEQRQARRRLGNTIGAALTIVGLISVALTTSLLAASRASPERGHFVSEYLLSIAIQLPMLTAYLVGLLLAMIWFSRSPAASLLVIGGLAILFLHALVSPALQIWLHKIFFENPGRQPQHVVQILRSIAVIHQMIDAAAMLLLIGAVFVGRARPPTLPRSDDGVFEAMVVR